MSKPIKLHKDDKKEERSKRKMPKKPRGVLLKVARKAWNDIAPVLYDMGALDEIDFPTFAIMLEHYALAVKAAETLREEGMFRRDENNVQRKHPALQVFRDNSQQYRQYIKEFALSPRARQLLDLDHYFKDANLEREKNRILNGDIDS